MNWVPHVTMIFVLTLSCLTLGCIGVPANKDSVAWLTILFYAAEALGSGYSLYIGV